MISVNRWVFRPPEEKTPDNTPDTATENSPDESAQESSAADGTDVTAQETNQANGAENESAEAPVDEHDAEANNPSFFPVGEPLTGDVSKFFSGNTYLNHLVPRGGPVINMTFEPGCRTNWHVHHNAGQALLVTGGAGWYQEEGKEPQPLRPGDIINVPAEIKHWHGAARDSWFSHLLVPIAVPGASNAFLEEVDDKEYDALPPSKEEGDSSPRSAFGDIAKLFGKK